MMRKLLLFFAVVPLLSTVSSAEFHTVPNALRERSGEPGQQIIAVSLGPDTVLEMDPATLQRFLLNTPYGQDPLTRKSLKEAFARGDYETLALAFKESVVSEMADSGPPTAAPGRGHLQDLPPRPSALPPEAPSPPLQTPMPPPSAKAYGKDLYLLVKAQTEAIKQLNVKLSALEERLSKIEQEIQ